MNTQGKKKRSGAQKRKKKKEKEELAAEMERLKLGTDEVMDRVGGAITRMCLSRMCFRN
jgi:hypothetical protein